MVSSAEAMQMMVSSYLMLILFSSVLLSRKAQCMGTLISRFLAQCIVPTFL